MTPGDIRKRVAEIADRAEYAHDEAHSLEDQLHRDVIQYFADQGYGVAIAALESKKLDFPRDCA